MFSDKYLYERKRLADWLTHKTKSDLTRQITECLKLCDSEATCLNECDRKGVRRTLPNTNFRDNHKLIVDLNLNLFLKGRSENFFLLILI